MVGQMDAPGVSSFDVPPAPYHNVTPIVTLYAVQQPRLENLATPQEDGVAMAVMVVLMAEEVRWRSQRRWRFWKWWKLW